MKKTVRPKFMILNGSMNIKPINCVHRFFAIKTLSFKLIVKLFASKQHKYTKIRFLKNRLRKPQFSGSNCEQF